MFRKQYKIKTSTTIKGSERRKLRSAVESSYTNLSADDLNCLVPSKGEMNQVKAMTHSGSVTLIFYSGSRPVFFQIENVIYPTVYTLWKFPHLLPTLITTPPVLEKLSNGADLMAPGVLTDDLYMLEMENLKINAPCAVRICGNKAPVAVGIALIHKEELCENGVKGKALSVVHFFKDTLWESGDQQDLPMLPELEESENVVQNLQNLEVCNESLDKNDTPEENTNEFNTNNSEENINDIKIEKPTYSMDELLYHSFMTALKAFGKKITLPVLTSTFYSSYVLKSCPSSFNLDIKKTTYKKLSTFLKSMQKENLLQIKELSKGVESITLINIESETIKAYRLDDAFKIHLHTEKEKSSEEVSTSNVQEHYKFPIVTELFVISANVKVLFEKFNLRKGESIPSNIIKDILKRYVKDNSLQNVQNPREVTLDPILSDCVLQKGRSKEIMTWEELQEAISCKMPHAYQIEFEGKQPVIKKGKLEPIQITVETRTANKKVTLINNLDVYGINPDTLAQHVQVAVAASTSISTTQNGRGTLVLIQGNQVKYLQKLFLEIYKVPRKYIQGLENIPGKKK